MLLSELDDDELGSGTGSWKLSLLPVHGWVCWDDVFMSGGVCCRRISLDDSGRGVVRSRRIGGYGVRRRRATCLGVHRTSVQGSRPSARIVRRNVDG
jgi:hypothetical protein